MPARAPPKPAVLFDPLRRLLGTRKRPGAHRGLTGTSAILELRTRGSGPLSCPRRCAPEPLRPEGPKGVKERRGAWRSDQQREGGARWRRGSQQGVSEQRSTRACRCPLALSGPPCAPPLPFPHWGRDHPPAQVTAPTSEKEQRALPVLCGSLGSQGTSLGQASGNRMSVQDSLGSPLWPQGKDAGTGGGRGQHSGTRRPPGPA